MSNSYKETFPCNTEYSNKENINKCKEFAKNKTSSARVDSFRGNGYRREPDEIYKNQYNGKIGECIAQRDLLHYGINTEVNFDILEKNDDGGIDLTDHGINYIVKQTKPSSSRLLLETDKYVKNKIDIINYFILVRTEIDNYDNIMYNLRIFDKETFNNKHIILPKGHKFSAFSLPLIVSNYCIIINDMYDLDRKFADKIKLSIKK